MAIEMPKRLQERRDELSNKHIESHYPHYIGSDHNLDPTYMDYEAGFNACWEELAPVVGALEVIKHDSNVPDNPCGSVVHLGKIARKALNKLEGNKND